MHHRAERRGHRPHDPAPHLVLELLPKDVLGPAERGLGPKGGRVGNEDASSPTIIRRGGMFETHGDGPNGHREGVALSGAQNELNFCSGSGDLALAAHIRLRQIGCRRIARAGFDGGCICFPFNSAPPRSYDAAGRGDNSVELNWGTCSVGCEKKLK